MPADPSTWLEVWPAVLDAARMQVDDACLVALLVIDHGLEESAAEALLDDAGNYAAVMHARRAGQVQLVRQAWTVVTEDPYSPPAAMLLRVLLANHVGWTSKGIDADMRKAKREMERMTPGERRAAFAAAAELERKRGGGT